MPTKEATEQRELLVQRKWRQEVERRLLAERERRVDAERRLAEHAARASENNTALARNNLRLQEQLARLRGEADLLVHDAGCQRAAAAARERAMSLELGRLRAGLARAHAEQQALRQQLAAKEGIIAYLESKLQGQQGLGGQLGAAAAGRVINGKILEGGAAAAGRAIGGKILEGGAAAAGKIAEGGAAAAGKMMAGGPLGKVIFGNNSEGGAAATGPSVPGPASSDVSSADSLAKLCLGASEDAGSEQQEGQEQQPDGEAGGSSGTAGSSSECDACSGDEALGMRSPPGAGSPTLQHDRAAAAAPAAAAAADLTPVLQRVAPAGQASLEPSGTVLRSSLRTRGSGVSYAEPSLRGKLRQGDPYTFGTAEAAAAAAAGRRSELSRARTKPRPLFPTANLGCGGALPLVTD